MTDLALTDLARQFLAERQAEARRIIANGAAHTESQRRLAWRVLRGVPDRGPAPRVQHMPPAPLVPPSPPWGFGDGGSAA